jgi:hypothetical protein
MRGPDSFYVYHERGTSSLRFDDLTGLHVNNGCTALVGEYGVRMLVVEGTKEAVMVIWHEIDNRGETLVKSGGGSTYWEHTGIDTKREGLTRVRLATRTPWHFDDENAFRFGHEPDVAAACAATQERRAKTPRKAGKPETLDA